MIPPRSSRDAPLTDVSAAGFQILLALADRPRHGYAIMQEVERCTDGRVRLGPATLYRTIRTMLEAGLIAEAPDRSGESDDERRRYYRLTGAGRSVAEGEAARLAGLVELARSRKLLRTPEARIGGAV